MTLFGDDEAIDREFEAFYASYPRHVGKHAALKAWKKLKPTAKLITVMLAALDQQKANNWDGKAKEFMPHASTWINNRRWEDEIEDSRPVHKHDWRCRDYGFCPEGIR